MIGITRVSCQSTPAWKRLGRKVQVTKSINDQSKRHQSTSRHFDDIENHQATYYTTVADMGNGQSNPRIEIGQPTDRRLTRGQFMTDRIRLTSSDNGSQSHQRMAVIPHRIPASRAEIISEYFKRLNEERGLKQMTANIGLL